MSLVPTGHDMEHGLSDDNRQRYARHLVLPSAVSYTHLTLPTILLV